MNPDLIHLVDRDYEVFEECFVKPWYSMASAYSERREWLKQLQSDICESTIVFH